MKKFFTQCLVCAILSTAILSCSKDVKSPVSASAAKVKVTNTPAQTPSQTPGENDHNGEGCHNGSNHTGS
ncbi:MAG: hypothetical protein ACTHJ5_05255 [Ilyomonas sp.]